MAEQSWWGRVVGAIEREYERRIRRASEVVDYGSGHRHHGHSEDHGPLEGAHGHQEEEQEEQAAIVNLPRGTRVGRAPAPPAGADDAS